MRPRRVVAPDETLVIFDQAVRERALAVVTVQEMDDWLTFKARFLEHDPAKQFFVLDYEPQHEEELPPIAPGQYVGISFRHKSRKVMFSTVIEAKGRFVVDDDTTIAAVRYRLPPTLTELQRRAYFRTPIPPDTPVRATVWEGGAAARAAAQQQPMQTYSGELQDLSCGGTLLQTTLASPPPWVDGATLGIELQLPDGKPPLVVNCIFRGVRHDEHQKLCLAVQFIGMEINVDGQIVLQRLAACVQRFHRATQTAKLTARRQGWGF
jgi:c-di-GMP-binding flagellar brake protein YcgR